MLPHGDICRFDSCGKHKHSSMQTLGRKTSRVIFSRKNYVNKCIRRKLK